MQQAASPLQHGLWTSLTKMQQKLCTNSAQIQHSGCKQPPLEFVRICYNFLAFLLAPAGGICVLDYKAAGQKVPLLWRKGRAISVVYYWKNTCMCGWDRSRLTQQENRVDVCKPACCAPLGSDEPKGPPCFFLIWICHTDGTLLHTYTYLCLRAWVCVRRLSLDGENLPFLHKILILRILFSHSRFSPSWTVLHSSRSASWAPFIRTFFATTWLTFLGQYWPNIWSN